jgi:NTE family protein
VEGRQEADAVIEGGGIHVLALAGAMQEFEERGFKPWRDVAGVGAGSILAAYLATGHDAKEAVALLTKTPWERFLDWGRGGRIGGYWNFLRRGALA